MATTIPNFLTTKNISNLDTYVYTTVTSGMHVVTCTLSPLVLPSGITIAIKQNASTIATSAVPTAAQSVISLSRTINSTAGDTISFVIASSVASDTGPNAFKGIINVHVGSSN